MTHELVADAEPPLVGRHRHQQVAAGPEPGGPRLYRGCVVFDVLEHLESADQVELTRFYVLDADVADLPSAERGRPAGRHRVSRRIGFEPQVVVALGKPDTEGTQTAADLQDVVDAVRKHP